MKSEQNDVLTNIKTRRSIRGFKQIEIPEETLEAVLETMLYAPSGSKHQTDRYYVIKNIEVLEELNELLKNEFLSLNDDDIKNKFIASAKKRAQNANVNFFYNAPCLVIATNDIDYPNAMADCAVALENLMLAAHSSDIGSCWINQLTWLRGNDNLKNFLREYGISNRESVFGAVALGYSSNPPSNEIKINLENIKIIL